MLGTTWTETSEMWHISDVTQEGLDLYISYIMCHNASACLCLFPPISWLYLMDTMFSLQVILIYAHFLY
jgi:hypothetical protein